MKKTNAAIYMRQGKASKQPANEQSEQARKDLQQEALKRLPYLQGKRVWFF